MPCVLKHLWLQAPPTGTFPTSLHPPQTQSVRFRHFSTSSAVVPLCSCSHTLPHHPPLDKRLNTHHPLPDHQSHPTINSYLGTKPRSYGVSSPRSPRLAAASSGCSVFTGLACGRRQSSFPFSPATTGPARGHRRAFSLAHFAGLVHGRRQAFFLQPTLQRVRRPGNAGPLPVQPHIII